MIRRRDRRPACTCRAAVDAGSRQSNSGDDRKDAAMAAEDPVLDVVAADLIEERGDERESAAAVRAAEQVERFGVHGGLSGSCPVSEVRVKR